MTLGNEKYKKLFLEEAEEQIQDLTLNFLKLEKNLADFKPLENIFRAAHSLKGASGFVGLNNLSSFLHSLENIISAIQNKKITLNSELINLFFKSIDQINLVIKSFAKNSETNFNFDKLKLEIEGLSSPFSTDQKINHNYKDKNKSEDKSSGQSSSSLSSSSSKPIIPELEKNVKISINKLDNFSQIIGELTVINSRFISLYKKMSPNDRQEFLTDKLENYFAFISRLSNRLHHNLLEIRQLPLKQIFNNYYKLVRDLSFQSSKKINLIIEGADLKVDKSYFDKINEALLQIIKNAIDHGIENPSLRVKNNKNETATITIKAFDGDNKTIIEIKDDGAGLPLVKIIEKIIGGNLATIDDLKKMTPPKIYNYIFTPGFSTAQTISDTSGRGIGLDIVKSNLEDIGGQIKLETKKNLGTKFTLILPKTTTFHSYLDKANLNLIKNKLEISINDLNLLQKTIALGMEKSILLLKKIFNNKIDFSSPKLKIQTQKQIPNHLGKIDDVYLGVLLPIKGDLKGNLLLVLEENIGFKLINFLAKTKNDQNLNEEGESIIKEIMNILGSDLLNLLADQTGLIIRPSLPNIIHDYWQPVIDSILLQDKDSFSIQISFFLNQPKNQNKPLANLFFIPTLETLKNLITHLKG